MKISQRSIGNSSAENRFTIFWLKHIFQKSRDQHRQTTLPSIVWCTWAILRGTVIKAAWRIVIIGTLLYFSGFFHLQRTIGFQISEVY